MSGNVTGAANSRHARSPVDFEGRQVDGRAHPAPGAPASVRRPAVCSRDLTNQGQARVRNAARRRPWSPRPAAGEPLGQPSASPSGSPSPSSVTVISTRSTDCRGRDDDVPARPAYATSALSTSAVSARRSALRDPAEPAAGPRRISTVSDTPAAVASTCMLAATSCSQLARARAVHRGSDRRPARRSPASRRRSRRAPWSRPAAGRPSAAPGRSGLIRRASNCARVCSTVNGVRSSWPASATKRRCSASASPSGPPRAGRPRNPTSPAMHDPDDRRRSISASRISASSSPPPNRRPPSPSRPSS